MNPYSPPATTSENQRHLCPICSAHVGFIRFAVPLGSCSQCGNYLAIRNWERRSLPWILGILAITTGPLITTFAGFQTRGYPMGRLILIWMVAIILHDKLAGRLVPAVCWGFFALRDDDRITSLTDSSHTGG